MNATFICQPTAPQPQWLGLQLRALLLGQEGPFDRFAASVAFVKFSGVSRIYGALEAFRAAGGRSSVSVGIDQKGTSKQGLELLRTVVDEVFVYHDISPGRTFHPKIYIFERPNQRATVLLGSGNLTAGGLFTNYEAHLRLDFNLEPIVENTHDRTVFADLLRYCNLHRDLTSPCVQRMSDETMADLEPLLLDEAAQGDSKTAEDEAAPATVVRKASRPGMFGTIGGPGAPPADIQLDRQGRRRRATTAVRGQVRPAVAVAQPGFWKVLSQYDVSATSSPGQIIIPIRFRGIFPDQQLTQGPDEGGKGRQWEASFPVQFRDGGFGAEAPDARFIVYEPKTGHPRPNTECRFTFRSQTIFRRLQVGDILVFTPIPTGPVRFQVERVPKGSKRYRILYSGEGRTFDTTS